MVALVILSNLLDRIIGVMDSSPTSSGVYRWFKPWLGQTKDYKMGILIFH